MADEEAFAPPETRRDPVTETLHGEEVVDPYRWLEETDDEAVEAWTAAQNDYTDRVVETPHQERLAAAYEEIARVTDYGGVKSAGDRYFQQITGPEEEQSVLYAYDSLAALRAGDGRVLVDPNELDDSGIVSVDWYVPGPNGQLVAYGIAEGGDEQYDIVVIDATDGQERDRVANTGRTGAQGFGWVPAAEATGDEAGGVGDDEAGEASDDGADEASDERTLPRGFYYVTTGGADEGTQLEKAVAYHALDETADRTVVSGYSPQEWPGIRTDGETLVIDVQDGWSRTDVWFADGDPATVEPEPLVTEYDDSFEPTLSDGQLYLTTDHEAPFGRVLSASVAQLLANDDPGLAQFEEVVPEGGAVIRDLAVTNDHLYCHAHRDARSEVTRHSLDEPQTLADAPTVDLPPFPSVGPLTTGTDGELFFTVETFADPPAVRRVTPEGSTETLAQQETEPDFEIETTQEWFESADGTEIPAFVTRRGDTEPDGDRPTLLTGYGGFRVNRTPSFDRFALSFLRAGGVVAQATLRGGTEYGSEWHEAGRREHKQNVFDDAIAVAEGLTADGWTRPDRLAVGGGSNGGLLVGALITQRPELFRAALCQVPLLDMLRFHRFLLGESWTSEYGSPDDPDAFEYIRDYSPYHNADAVAYPATMLTTALGDTRVHPSHARKMTALLQERNTGPHPIVLRVDDDAGHGVGKPVSKIVRERSEFWGFLAAQLGVDLDALA